MRSARGGLLCGICVLVLACGAESYASYDAASRATSLPDYVPASAHSFRVYAEKGGDRWLRFELRSGGAQRLVKDMEALTFTQARSGRFTPPRWRGEWPDELAQHPPSATSSSTRFYRAPDGTCVAVDWITSVVYSYPCGG